MGAPGLSAWTGEASCWDARASRPRSMPTPQRRSLIEQACRIANRNLYESEWTVFIGDEPYGTTCPAAPAEASQG